VKKTWTVVRTSGSRGKERLFDLVKTMLEAELGDY
jgi:hypothetical protein